MKFVTYLYYQSRGLLIFAAMAGVAGGISSAATAVIISHGAWTRGHNLLLVACAFFGLCITTVASKSASEIALLNLTQRAIFQLRIRLSRSLLSTPIHKLRELGEHGLIVILTKDIDTFIQAFQLVPLAFGNVILIAACLAYLAWLSWKIFAVFACSLAVIVTLYRWAERYPLAHIPAIRTHVDAVHRHFHDLIRGTRELQLNTQRGQRFVDDVIAPTSRDFMVSFRKGMIGYTWVNNVGAMQAYLVIGMILFVAPLVLNESAPTIMTATFILLYMIQPISALMASLPAVRQAGVALSKIEQLEGDLTLSNEWHTPQPAIAKGLDSLELRNVCHRFYADKEDRHFMLGPINLTVGAGELIFVVGGNGSGKTTLAMLILGLYAPESGSVWLNGEEVTEQNRERYRGIFSAIFADFHLFEQLLDIDNHSLSERATRYIETLGISHKVSIKDGKFSTINLSTGQRKRLALVMSYLEDRPIYLFDEWAADQDPEFKRVYYRELLPELKRRGKTVFVISHDDAYFDCADRIINMEDGRLTQTRRPSSHVM